MTVVNVGGFPWISLSNIFLISHTISLPFVPPPGPLAASYVGICPFACWYQSVEEDVYLQTILIFNASLQPFLKILISLKINFEHHLLFLLVSLYLQKTMFYACSFESRKSFNLSISPLLVVDPLLTICTDHGWMSISKFPL